MDQYQLSLIIDGQEVPIPILPEKLNVTSAGKNEHVTVLGLGEVLLLRKKGLRMVAWESFFPAHVAPYTRQQLQEPIALVQKIQNAREQNQPVRLELLGTDLDCNIWMGIEEFEYEERAGELGDVYYTIKLCEWKDISPRRIILNQQADGVAVVSEPSRVGEPEVASETSYVVQPGDCLWTICQKHYGDGARCWEIAKVNGIVNPNLIYPGQVIEFV